MFKNKINIYTSLTFTLLGLISLAITMSVSSKIGGIILLTVLVLQLVFGLVFYYGFTNNTFFGRSKKRTTQESLINQSNGFKSMTPLFLSIIFSLILITVVFVS